LVARLSIKAVSGWGESRGTFLFSAGHMAHLAGLGFLARNFRIPASAAEQDQNRKSGLCDSMFAMFFG
jgi:hypothetical protein